MRLIHFPYEIFLIWNSFCPTFSYYFDETLNPVANSSCMPCSEVKLGIKIKGSICSYLTPRKLSYIGPFIFLYVKKFHRICRIHFELKMSYAEAAGAGTQSNSQHGPREMKDSTTIIRWLVLALVSALIPWRKL